MSAFSTYTLNRIAEVIPERLTTVDAITRFFNEMGYKLPSYPGGGYSKKNYTRDILSDIQKTQGAEEIMHVLLRLCHRNEYPDEVEHQDMLHRINALLQPYEFSISLENVLLNKQGQQVELRSEKDDISLSIRLFEARDYHHEIVKHARDLFAKDEYFHAVFECCKAFDRYVSRKSQLSKTGIELMGAALSLPKGPLRLNSQQTDTEKSLQEGVMHLSMGLMKAVRNPEGHETYLERPMNLKDALDILSLISYLYRRIDGAFYLPMP